MSVIDLLRRTADGKVDLDYYFPGDSEKAFMEMVKANRGPVGWVKVRQIKGLNDDDPSASETVGFVWFRLDDVQQLFERGRTVATATNAFQIHPDDWDIVLQAFEYQIGAGPQPVPGGVTRTVRSGDTLTS